MGKLTNREMEEIIAIDRELSEKSLHYFVRKAFPLLEPKRTFIDGWHIEAICEHLEACYYGQIRELLINIPPRHMKSLLVSVAFPSWVWTKSAEKRFLSASYAKSLSIRDSVKTRRVIQSPWYQARWGHRFQLTGDQNAKEKFENDQTGYRLATSVDGTGTGEGGDFVSVDDPHKVREAESKIQRKGVISWWDDEMSSRENDPKTGCKIITMQRIHEGDLSGHVIQQGGYVHLMLPAEYESARKCVTQIGWSDPRKNDGDLLWPKRFDRPALEKIKTRMGSRTAAGQLQQRPSPEEGDVIKRGWWKFYKELPGDMETFGISADLTFKDTEKGDYVAFGCWGARGANKYLVDIDHDKMNFNNQLIRFAQFCAKHPMAMAKWIEDAANGAALVAVVTGKIPGVIAVVPKGSKIARAESIAPQAEAGNIYLPDPTYEPHIQSGLAQKVLDFMEEWAVFPNGNHDDRVDMTSLGVSQLSDGMTWDMELVSLTGESKWIGR